MAKRSRAKECLELVHTNMYGTFSVHSWGAYGYFITFNDNYSRFGLYMGDLMPWIHSLNLRWDRITCQVYTKSFRLDQGNMSSKFDFFH